MVSLLASRRNYKEATRPRRQIDTEDAPDQDSFFSSFLGSNKQSTPKTSKLSTLNSNQAGFERLKLGKKDVTNSPQRKASGSEQVEESLVHSVSGDILDSKRKSRLSHSRSTEDDKSTGTASKKVEQVKKKEKFENFKEFTNDSVGVADDKIWKDSLGNNDCSKTDKRSHVKEQKNKEDTSCCQERSSLSASDMGTDNLNQKDCGNIGTTMSQSVDADFEDKEIFDRETLKSEAETENKETAKVENDIVNDEVLEVRKMLFVADQSSDVVTENGTLDNTVPDKASCLDTELPTSNLQSCSSEANPKEVSNAHKDNKVENNTLPSDPSSEFEQARNDTFEPGELKAQNKTDEVLLSDSNIDLGNTDTSSNVMEKLELETGSLSSRENGEQSKKRYEINNEIDCNAESKYESVSNPKGNLRDNVDSVAHDEIKKIQQKEPSNLNNDIEREISERDAAKSSNLVESEHHDLSENNVDFAVTLHPQQRQDDGIVLGDEDTKKIKILEMVSLQCSRCLMAVSFATKQRLVLKNRQIVHVKPCL